MNPGVLIVCAKAGETHLICLRYGMQYWKDLDCQKGQKTVDFEKARENLKVHGITSCSDVIGMNSYHAFLGDFVISPV